MKRFFVCPVDGFRTTLRHELAAHVESNGLKHRKRARFAMKKKGGR